MNHVGKRFYRVAATVLCTAAATACTNAPEQSPAPEPDLGQVTTVTSRSQVVTPPLLQYKTTADEQFLIQQAAERFTIECMARFGVVGIPVESVREDVVAARNGAANRYGPVTLEEAAAANTPKRGQEREKKSHGAAVADPREAELRNGQAASGQPSKLRDNSGAPVPRYGCGREGFDKLGYRPDDLLLVDDLLNQSLALLERDSRYRAVEEKWAQCMQGRGFALKRRGEPAKDAAELQARTKPDVECALSVNYVGVVNALDVAYQKQLIAKNSATLTAVRENNKSMAMKAQEALRG